ncbi:MAG TPA: pilus assembly protein TadG-related protein [Candidatus Dormibacteraeota bacterium]|nr:pilus assembly protein TadG-related protein [Candidatus Dormibacteraeota bacterium]
MRADESQRGQVLVIFAGGIVVFLLLAALVVDLGFVWMLQRHEQNAADPGAIAAARYIHPAGGGAADPTKMFGAACFYARENGFFERATDNSQSGSGCVAANDAFGSTLTVNYPPSIAAGQFAGDLTKVEVAITQPHRAFLAQFAGLSTITVSSGAVGSFDTGDAGSSSLTALAPTGCAAGQIGGNSSVTIQPVVAGTPGGYIQINSNCISGNATNNTCDQDGTGALKITGTGSVVAPQAFVRGSCASNGNASTNVPVTESANYVGDPLAGLRPPSLNPIGAYCGYQSDGTPANGATQTTPTGPGSAGCSFKKNTIELFPGTYYGGWQLSGSPIIDLHPGIYILAGGGIADNGGLLQSVAGPSGVADTARVLIYSTSNPNVGCQSCPQGDITVRANAALNLKGLNSSPCPPISSTGCPYQGMLLWQDAAGAKSIVVNGQGSLNIAGTIYDATGNVQINGGSSTTGCTGTSQNCAAIQVIAWTFIINGGAGLVMPYDPSQLYHLTEKGLVK